eukprot:TRINITY_DN64388_c0_g1_i2.p1 TRINITY_DN64388_c0_g1~~TRINITY_DN64388_c0_g1_i2.p1  ORF type:complete len:552 (-),score=107.33 TRINITY_DN64388_c0_g1_i2:37-1692(-)
MPVSDGACSPRSAGAEGEPSGHVELFVPGRLCLFGEHSDWAGSYRRFNADIPEGCALVCGTSQGIYARARRLPDKRVLIFKTPSGEVSELPMDDETKLRQVAKSASFFSYIAGAVLEVGKHFRVDGAEIDNYKTDLPLKKGLSSSAAVCVLAVRALNQLYDLKLTVHGEMDMAYRGEINTPSRCGRLDQCVAFGQCVTKMTFDNDIIATESVRVATPLYLIAVDLCAKKDTKEILKCLNEAYPFPRNDTDRSLHTLLGDANLETSAEAIAILAEERDPTRMAERMGALMSAAQERWDKLAVPLCPHELKAPVLHKLLECPELKPFVTGGKGVGSQGDGSAQLMCRSAEAQDAAMKIVESLGMVPLRLTIPASKAVRTAVMPVAGFCSGMWPVTKSTGPWLFPVCVGEAVKPAICWLCEDLIAAGIERIVLIVNEATEAQMTHLFKRRELISNLNKVASTEAAYDEMLMEIGRRLHFVRQDEPHGIASAVSLCERVVGGEPFVLAWGDHLSTTTASTGESCIKQLLKSFDGRRSVRHLHLPILELCGPVDEV